MKTMETVKKDIEKIVNKYIVDEKINDYRKDYMEAHIVTYIFKNLIK